MVSIQNAYRCVQLTVVAIHLRDDVIQGLCYVGKPVNFHLLAIERMDEPSVVVSHLRQLRRDLSREFYTMLERRVRFESLAFDLFQQIGTASKELGMRELPGLSVTRGPLGTRSLRYNTIYQRSPFVIPTGGSRRR